MSDIKLGALEDEGGGVTWQTVADTMVLSLSRRSASTRWSEPRGRPWGFTLRHDGELIAVVADSEGHQWVYMGVDDDYTPDVSTMQVEDSHRDPFHVEDSLLTHYYPQTPEQLSRERSLESVAKIGTFLVQLELDQPGLRAGLYSVTEVVDTLAKLGSMTPERFRERVRARLLATHGPGPDEEVH